MNIKCPYVGYSKSISSGQYVFIFCVFSLSKMSHFNMRHPVITFLNQIRESIANRTEIERESNANRTFVLRSIPV